MSLYGDTDMTDRQCALDVAEGTDCPRPVVWRWFPYGHDGESAYLCDQHAADEDLSDLRDLTDPLPDMR